GMIDHARSFAHLSGRNYLQVIVQAIKAFYYLSPLLLIPALFVTRERLRRWRFFFIYLFLGFVFYFIIFDFSAGALDKYLMYMIAPLAAISGDVLSAWLSEEPLIRKKWPWLILGGFFSLGALALNFFPQALV